MNNFRQKIKHVRNFKEQNKIALIRVDYNSSQHDSTRIAASLETINHLRSLGTKVVLLSHSGRPEKVDSSLSLKFAAEKLAHMLNLKFVDAGQSFNFPAYAIPHLVFSTGDIRTLTRSMLESHMRSGDILFAENIRFYREEESLDSKFAQVLAGLADIYVNESFGVDHHASVSVSELPKYVPAYAGFNVMKEIDALSKVLTLPPKPLVLVVGGSKISEKTRMLDTVGAVADHVLVGGALANLFLKAKNFQIGNSKFEQSGLPQAAAFLRNNKHKLILPLDVVVAKTVDGVGEVKDVSKVGANDIILDIGPATITEYSRILKQAKTIVWNGPMGYFEKESFAHGTTALTRLIASRGKGKAYVVVGGGETITALSNSHMTNSVDFVSTGGGAMLSFLGNLPMPGIEALMQ